MFTNGISDQLSDSFEELMLEIRAMRRELEGIRAALQERQPAPHTPKRASAPATARVRRTAKVA
jgi:hypothetical protein